MLDWDRMLWKKFLLRWCFDDVPFSTHALRRLISSGHIGSFDWVNYRPRDSR
jgi:hypothetical protein